MSKSPDIIPSRSPRKTAAKTGSGNQSLTQEKMIRAIYKKIVDSEPTLSDKILCQILRHVALGSESLSEDLAKFLAAASNKTVPVINDTLDALILQIG
jgi:hypothetical protein